jgi:solute carrier family 25 carnitine/acylcarnitine transporter 20/29
LGRRAGRQLPSPARPLKPPASPTRALPQGVASPLAGQMFFRASLFGAFGWSKRWLATNADGTTRPLVTSDFYKAGAMTGFVAAFTEGPIDFYKSQIQARLTGV